MIRGNWDAQSGYAGALQMLRETPQFSAVLVANDQMALGVLSAFHQQQISIPGEKSVIGYDDTYESSFFYPALTTVSLDLDLQGKEGCWASAWRFFPFSPFGPVDCRTTRRAGKIEDMRRALSSPLSRMRRTASLPCRSKSSETVVSAG